MKVLEVQLYKKKHTCQQVGGLLVTIGFMGCCGVMCQYESLLKIYLTVTIIILVLQVDYINFQWKDQVTHVSPYNFKNSEKSDDQIRYIIWSDDAVIVVVGYSMKVNMIFCQRKNIICQPNINIGSKFSIYGQQFLENCYIKCSHEHCEHIMQ